MSDMTLYKETEHRGYTCKVYFDPDPISPAEWDTLGTIYSNSRGYDPCKHKIDEILVEGDDGFMHIDPEYVSVPIYCYEHGGIALHTARTGQFADKWDSGLFGVMAVHKDKIKEEGFGDIRIKSNLDNVINCLSSEVESWNMYYQGIVFGYVVENEDGCETDSCWGFYGFDGAEEAMAEGIGIIDAIVDEAERKEAEETARIQHYEMVTEPFWID